MEENLVFFLLFLKYSKSQTFGMMSAGGSCRFLLPLQQQHMAKQMAMISSEIANEPDAIMMIGNFPVKWIQKRDSIKYRTK